MHTNAEPKLPHPDRRAVRILARSIAREFEAQGHEARILIMLAAELIEEASQRLRRPPETP
jgi:hypothetical protein